MTWEQILSSKKVAVGSGGPGRPRNDDYHVLTGHGDQYVKDVDALHVDQDARKSPAYLIKRNSDGIVVGAVGKVGDQLGAKHKFSRERGVTDRPITFTHLFVGPKGSAIPALPDLIELHKGQLEGILDRVHSGEDPTVAAPVDFSKSASKGTHWDQMAADVSAGRAEGGVFSGSGELIRKFDAVSKASVLDSKKKIQVPKGNLRGPLIIGSAVIATVAVGAWAMLERSRQSDQPLTHGFQLN